MFNMYKHNPVTSEEDSTLFKLTITKWIIVNLLKLIGYTAFILINAGGILCLIKKIWFGD